MKKMFIAMSLLFSLMVTSVNAAEVTVTVEAKITGLYVAFFNRAADQKGLDYWIAKTDEVGQAGGDVSSVFRTIAGGFATHPTFKSTYGNLENKAFVEAIYRNALGRDGDAKGIAYWTDLIDRAMSRPDMVATFVELAMVTDLTAEKYKDLSAEDRAAGQLRQDLITNKATVAVAFTKQLEELSNVENNDAPESDPAYKASIKIISKVTEDKATVTLALAFLNDEVKESADPIAHINEVTTIPYADGFSLTNEDNSTSQSSTTYDADGNMIADEYTLTQSDGSWYKSKTTYTYDTNGKESTSEEIQTQSDGSWEKEKTTYTYDANGKLIASEETGAYSDDSTSQGSSTYDSNGNKIASENTQTQSDDSWEKKKITYTYDANGNKSASEEIETRSDGSSSHIIYTYNADGNMIASEFTSTYAGGYIYQSSSTYDANGNKIAFELAITLSDGSWKKEHYTYDSSGNELTYSWEDSEGNSG